MGEAAVISGGFSAPVFDAQAAFTAVMHALARPGTVHGTLPAVAPPDPLYASTAVLIAALCDADTNIWLDAGLHANADIAGWIRFHTGAVIVRDVAEAHFAAVSDAAKLPALDRFALGSQEYPERSATVILQVDDLYVGSPLLLAGPGIETQAAIGPTPLPPLFVAQWQMNRVLFPRGIDMVLAAPGAIAGLPRSVTVEEG